MNHFLAALLVLAFASHGWLAAQDVAPLAPTLTVDRGAARAEYEKRARTIAGQSAGKSEGKAEGEVAARLALARWCEQQGLAAEMRREVDAILARDADHAAARALLGHENVDGRWLEKAEAMRARGYVLHRGQWLRKYDAVVQQHREQVARERAQLEGALNESFRRLASSAAPAREAALGSLVRLAEQKEWPELARLARQQKTSYDQFWQQQLVTATVQLQKSELLGMTPFTTSLGAGNPVTLQLPRLRSVSIGTTVVLPAGSGK